MSKLCGLLLGSQDTSAIVLIDVHWPQIWAPDWTSNAMLWRNASTCSRTFFPVAHLLLWVLPKRTCMPERRIRIPSGARVFHHGPVLRSERSGRVRLFFLPCFCKLGTPAVSFCAAGGASQPCLLPGPSFDVPDVRGRRHDASEGWRGSRNVAL